MLVNRKRAQVFKARSVAPSAKAALRPVHLRELKVATKDGRLIRFKPLPAQIRIRQLIRRIRAEMGYDASGTREVATGSLRTRARGRVSIVIVKPRQTGTSTECEAQMLRLVTRRPYTEALVIAHVAESAAHLHGIATRFYRHLPAGVRPEKKAQNARGLAFAPPLESRIGIEVVGEGAGRSRTLHGLHASEVALWPGDVRETLAALRGGLVSEPWCLEILESTGYGLGGGFYEEYQAAKNDGRALFFAWHEDPRYRTTPALTLEEVRRRGGPSEAIAHIEATIRRCQNQVVHDSGLAPALGEHERGQVAAESQSEQVRSVHRLERERASDTIGEERTGVFRQLIQKQAFLGGPSEAIEHIERTVQRCQPVRDLPEVSREVWPGLGGEQAPHGRRALEEARAEGDRVAGHQEEAGLDGEQIAWLYSKLVIEYGGDVKRFQREFPSTEQEAFEGDARQVFGPEIMRRVDDSVKATGQVGGPVLGDSEALRCLAGTPGINLLKMVVQPGGPDSAYVIGADPAEGLEHGDDSALVVFDRVRRRCCACAVTGLDPDEFATLLLSLARFYTQAWICVESNNHGYTVLTRLVDAGYPRIWRENLHVKLKRGAIGEFGYRTTAKSKAAGVGAIIAGVREEKLAIPFPEIRDQMRTYVRDERGKMGAVPGCKDDLVSALWLATVAADDLGFNDPLASAFASAKIDAVKSPISPEGLVVVEDFQKLERMQHGPLPIDRIRWGVKGGRIGERTL